METRINSAKKNQNQVSSAIRDSISLILFDSQVFNFEFSIFEFESYLFKDILIAK